MNPHARQILSALGTALNTADPDVDVKAIVAEMSLPAEIEAVAVKFGLYFLQLKRSNSGPAYLPRDPIKLWRVIEQRTDSIFEVNEPILSLFEAAIQHFLRASGCRGKLEMGPLKDPVRVVEKAANSYRVDQDGRPYFSDDVLPEACVLDIVRARYLCMSSEGLLKMQQSLVEGYVADVDGKRVTLRVIRAKMKFGRDQVHF
jgi:hypothetical protein